MITMTDAEEMKKKHVQQQTPKLIDMFDYN